MSCYGRAAFLGGLLWLLAGCGEVVLTEPGTITGTVSAPPGGGVAGTVVVACFENLKDCEERFTTTVEQGSSSAPYRLTGLPAGGYGIFAYKDVNRNGNRVENGDYYGSYALDPETKVTPPASEIDIQLYVLDGATSVPPAVSEAVRVLAANAEPSRP